jgi:preprotein translocase SecF subunit
MQVQFTQKVDVSHLRNALEKGGIKSPVIQVYGEASQNQFVIKTGESDTAKIEKAGNEIAADNKMTILKVDVVGPTVGKDLAHKASLAVLWSFIGIGIYLAWRFEWKYAIASVIMLMHDVCFAFGVYALSGREINLPTVAAILTIMGFSVNDAIITFDRVRENLKIMRKTSFSDIVDVSVNQTLSRSIITNLTVLFSVVALLLFGGGSIQDFAFILLIGFTVGVYSTIFVASALVVDISPKPVKTGK